MKRHRLTVVVSILLLGTAGPISQTWTSEAMNNNHQNESKPLYWILAEIGRDHDCFFTMEDGFQEGEPSNRLESEWTERPLEKGSSTEKLEHLRHSVPNFSYEINPLNQRVVHVIDPRIKWQRGYALEGTIASLDFAGKVNELPDEIGRQGIPIALPPWQSLQEQRDGGTTVRVKGQGLTVRDALSNFVKLDGREGRILWIARTRLVPGAVSYVFYPFAGIPAKQ